jgi:outer membrane immunogenic protein
MELVMKIVVLSSLALLGVSSPALAQDFTGPRVEGRIGYDRTTFDVEVVVEDAENIQGSERESGFSFGGEVGYDIGMGADSTFGAYAGVDFTSAEFCSTEGGAEGCLKGRENITAGVRAGVAVTPASLAYLKGGFSRGSFKATLDDGLEEFSGKEHLNGWHLGAGAEMGFGTGLYGKLEYVYTEYNNLHFLDEDDAEVATIDAGRHQVLAGVGFRF